MKSNSASRPKTDVNIAGRLRAVAAKSPEQIALASPLGRYRQGQNRKYKTVTFQQLEQQTSSIAAGLQKHGLVPGMKIVLLVRFGADFIALVFALLKAGAVVVLVDPGMGRKNLIQCLEQCEPEGFVAIPMAHLIRMVFRSRFPNARFLVTVGPTLGVLPTLTLKQLQKTPANDYCPPKLQLDSPAAIIFTTGSTGPPKGVEYTHRTFNNQVDQLVEHYQIKPGGRDLSGFPLFGLFNAVMGTTTIIPDMDPTRPADVDPPRLLDAIDQWKINQAFGSPALWTTVGRYANDHRRTIPSLRRVLSAGAPVPPSVLTLMRGVIAEDGKMFTPYGATEALPIASIESRDVLGETAAACQQGRGTCVGKRFSGIEWKIIAIDDGPLEHIGQIRELPNGEIGELMVAGEVVTRRYVTRLDQNPLHKVNEGDRIWHRMGDVGYLDAEDRFWCCGRKSHRVVTPSGTMFTEPCEAIFNTHSHIHRSALVGIGTKGQQVPVIIVEVWPEHFPKQKDSKAQLVNELRALGQKFDITRSIRHFMIYPKRLPTDIRHNSKIFREKLVPWAMKRL
jgi:olefin beta-lactone synthetase